MQKVKYEKTANFVNSLMDWFSLIEQHDYMVTDVVLYDNKEADSVLPSAVEIRSMFPKAALNTASLIANPKLTDDQKSVVSRAVEVLELLQKVNEDAKEKDKKDFFFGAVVSYDISDDTFEGKPLRLVLKCERKDLQIHVYG